tara:strand:+ start:204 stop:485 length:282 start_codon:yes stop_codon:yes gene_type:complete
MLDKVLRRWAFPEEVKFCTSDSERTQNSSFAGLIEQMIYAKFARKFAKPVVASLPHEARPTYFWLFLATHSGCCLHGRSERFFSARWGQAAVQ